MSINGLDSIILGPSVFLTAIHHQSCRFNLLSSIQPQPTPLHIPHTTTQIKATGTSHPDSSLLNYLYLSALPVPTCVACTYLHHLYLSALPVPI